MGRLLPNARRRAILRRAKQDLWTARCVEMEQERTPAPVSVQVEPARPAPARRAHRPAGSRRPLRAPLVAALGAVLVLAALAFGRTAAPRGEVPIARKAVAARVLDLALPPEAPRSVSEPAADPAPEAPRADAHLDREGYGHIPGGVVFIPSTFSSKDGAYDLYVHFHGNTKVVLESAEYAGLNAIVAVVNLGVNSAPYLDGYEMPGSFERTLGAVARVLGDRGLEHARLRRVAVGSWSGGYGAVSRILDRNADMLDAVLVLDGIHCGFLDDGKLNVLVISPFLAGAKRAAEGKMLFTITHSEIDPGTYAGTYLTAAYLLDAVHARREEPLSVPEHVQLKAAEGAVSKKLEKFMEPYYDARVGTFHVRGYRGNTPEHHMAHLFQMGATVLPELVERWRTP